MATTMERCLLKLALPSLFFAITATALAQAASGPNPPASQRAEERFYQRWLDEDVRWIITDEERGTFRKLSSNAERDQFIEAFWMHRDPTPDTSENEFKEEHYRRMLYANERFPYRDVSGWRSDRGRIYITYGKPDSIDSHPAGGPYQRAAEEGGGSTTTFPFEIWRYRYLEGIGKEIEIEFVDRCGCNEYHMSLDRTEKDALAPHKPKATAEGTEPLGKLNLPDRGRQYDNRLQQFARLNRAPEVKFKDLEAVANTKVRYNLLPLDVRVDFLKITADTVLMPVTVQVPNRELTFVNKDGVQRNIVNIFGRLSTLTGRVVETFESTVHLDIPADLLEKVLNNSSLYWKALLMRPGHYRLDIAVKDVNGGKLGTFGQGITVPEFSGGQLTSSTLILADVMETVPSSMIGDSDFILGNTKVRPKVQPANGKPVSFKKDQKANFWMQVYNLGLDEKTKSPSATVQYLVVNTTTNKPVVDITESTQVVGNTAAQMTLKKSLPLSRLDPGIYQVTIKITDQISKQTISPTANFAVE